MESRNGRVVSENMSKSMSQISSGVMRKTPRRNMFDVCGQCHLSKKTSGGFLAPLRMTGPMWLFLLTKLANGGKSRYD